MSHLEESERLFKFSQVISKKMMNKPLDSARAMSIVSLFQQFHPDDYDSVEHEEEDYYHFVMKVIFMLQCGTHDMKTHRRQFYLQKDKVLVTDKLIKGCVYLAFLVTKMANLDSPWMAAVDNVISGELFEISDVDAHKKLTLKQGLATGLMEAIHATIQTKESMMQIFDESNGYLLLGVFMEEDSLWSDKLRLSIGNFIKEILSVNQQRRSRLAELDLIPSLLYFACYCLCPPLFFHILEAATLLPSGENDLYITGYDVVRNSISIFISYVDECGDGNESKINYFNIWGRLILSLSAELKDDICVNTSILTEVENWLASALEEVAFYHNTLADLPQSFAVAESLLDLLSCITLKSVARQSYILRNHPSLLALFMQKMILYQITADGMLIPPPGNSLCEKLLLAIAQLTTADERTPSPLCDMDGACETLLSYFDRCKVDLYDGRIQHGAYSILNTMFSVVSSATVEKREELLPAIWQTFKSIVWILDSDFAMNNYEGTVLIAVANFFECIVQNLPNDNSASLLQLVDFCHCASEKNVPLLIILNGMESGNILYKKIGLPLFMKSISRLQDIYIILNDKLAQLGSLHDSSGLNSADTERLAWAQSQITIGKSTELSFSLVH